MDSQLGLMNVWHQGDFVTKAVALLLIGMSLASWIVILVKALDVIRYKRLARHSQDFWHSEDFATALNKLGKDDSNPFRALALEGREAAAHHRNTKAHLHDALDVSDWITRAPRNGIDEFTARLQTAVLASVGSTVPIRWTIRHRVGHLISALMSIGLAGQATIDKVAGLIGEALIMTALGLAVAIPRVLGYNALVRGNKFVLTKLNSFAHDLHAYFVTGARAQGVVKDNALPLRKG